MSNWAASNHKRRNQNNWLRLVLVLGVGLALLVATNSVLQYRRYAEFQARARAMGRTGPSSAPLERNLIINGAASLALLACTLVIGVRTRFHLRAKGWEQQLAGARAVQSALIPGAEPGGETLGVATEFVPAHEVGGDICDVYETGAGTVAFAVGDVAGKGLPAAMLMGLIHGALRTNLWFASADAQEDFAARLNAGLLGRTSEARFASLMWGTYDPRRAQLRYVSAGHCPGFVLRDGQILRLDSTGPVLGLLREPGHRQAVAGFHPGDLLVLYSDGVVESTDASGEEFGEERLMAAIAGCAGKSAVEARWEIMRSWREFLGGRQPDDDLTLLILEARRPEPVLAAGAEKARLAAA